jgi:large subunit ribosomal protein L19e
MDPNHLEDIKNAITRADMRKMISHGYIKVKPTKIKKPDYNPRKTKKGPGSRKGSAYARLTKKRRWMNTVRPLRRMLKELRDKGVIDTNMYRKTYMMVKSGAFRSRSHLKLHLKQRGVLDEEGS